MSTLLELINSPISKPFRRLFFKRMLYDGTNRYFETNWQQIEEKYIVSIGQIDSEGGGINRYQNKFPSLNLKLNNSSGYFNSEDEGQSFFYGFYSRQNTKVKVEAGYIDENGTEYPANTTLYEGNIWGDIQSDIDDGTIVFKVRGPDYILNQIGVDSLNFPSTTTVDYAPWRILRGIEYYSNATVDFSVSKIIGHDKWAIDIVPENTFGLETDYYYTASVDEGSAWEFMQKLALVYNCRIYINNFGQLYFGAHEFDSYQSEITGTVADDDCIAHWNLNNNLDQSVGDPYTNIMTCTATPAYESAALDTGFLSNVTDKSYLIVNNNEFYPQSFCIQFWYKPKGFDVSNCAAPETIAMLSVTMTTAIANDSEETNYEYMQIGFGYYPGQTAGAGTVLGIGKKKNLGGYDTTYCECYSNTAINLTDGMCGFFAFVHNAYGINGTRDTYRIYYGHENDSSVSLIASTSIGSVENNSGDVCGSIIGTGHAGRLFNFLPLSAAAATGAAVIDDIKIYNYAKSDFSDFKSESIYMKRKKFSIVGPSDTMQADHINIIGNVSINEGFESVFNYIEGQSYSDTVFYTTDQTSIGTSYYKYGKKLYKFDCSFINGAFISQACDGIYASNYLPKKEIDCTVKFMPALNLYDILDFTYQSKNVVIIPAPNYTEDWTAWNVGDSILGSGTHEYTLRHDDSNAVATINSNGKLDFYDASNPLTSIGMIFITCNNPLLTNFDGGTFEVKVKPLVTSNSFGIGYHLSSDGGYLVRTGWEYEISNSAYYGFNNAGENYIVFTASASLPITDASRSISFWIRPDTRTTDHAIIYWGNDSNNTNFGAAFLASSPQVLSVCRYIGDDAGVHALLDDQLYHVGISYDQSNSTLRTWLNGVLDIETVTSDFNTGVSYFQIGQFNFEASAAYRYRGDLYRVGIYDNALTESNILTLCGSRFVEKSFKAGTRPNFSIYAAGYIWVSNYNSANVTKIDPATKAVVGYITGITNPAGMAYDGTYIWVSDGNTHIYYCNPATLAIVGNIAGFSGPVGIAFDGTNLWVGSWTSANLYKVDPVGMTILATINTGLSQPQVTYYQDGYVWVFGVEDTRIMKYNKDTNALVNTITGLDGPGQMEKVNNYYWVTNWRGTSLAKIDCNTETVVSEISGLSEPWGLAYDGRYFWIYGESTTYLWIIDVASEKIIDTFRGIATNGPLIYAEGNVWGGTTHDTFIVFKSIPDLYDAPADFSTGLIFYAACNELSGTTCIDSIAGNNGTIAGTMTGFFNDVSYDLTFGVNVFSLVNWSSVADYDLTNTIYNFPLSEAFINFKNIKLSLSAAGTDMTLYIDGYTIGTVSGTDYLSGTFGFYNGTCGTELGSESTIVIENILAIPYYATIAARQINILNEKYEIVRMAHNLDNFETRLTLTEVL